MSLLSHFPPSLSVFITDTNKNFLSHIVSPMPILSLTHSFLSPSPTRHLVVPFSLSLSPSSVSSLHIFVIEAFSQLACSEMFL